MKTLIAILTTISLCLSSCSTTGGNVDTGAIAATAVSYGAARHLASAKTLEAYQSKQADLAALAAVLKAVNNQGIDPATLRNLIGQKFGSKPEVLLLANLVLMYYAPPAGGAPRNELLARVIPILEAASTQPPPVF